MTALFVVIPITLVLLAVAIGVFVWSVNKGQFENLDSAAYLPLSDDDPVDAPKKEDEAS